MSEIPYTVIKDLARLLKDEAEFLYGVRDQVKKMERELKRMQAFFEDADAVQHLHGSARQRNWVEEIRDVSYELEDLIELFIIKRHLKQRRSSKAKLLAASFKRYTRIPCTLRTHHKVGVELEKIDEKIKDTADSLTRYGIPNIGEGSESRPVQQRRQTSLLPPDEKDIVGLHRPVEEIMGRLRDADGKRCVISICGMGGLGKTTLARKVYNKVKADGQFSCFAWIAVSKEYNEEELLTLMLKELEGGGKQKKTGGESEESLSDSSEENREKKNLSKAAKETIAKKKEHIASKLSKLTKQKKKLYELLKEEKCFIVLDDVWSVSFWEMMKAKFPDVNKSSAVMITTRNEEVAKFVSQNNPPINMKFLSDKECEELLLKKAGLDDVANVRGELLEPAKQIIKRCDRLPLALVVFGSILSGRMQIATEWWKVADKIKWELSKRPEDCIQVLSLSYDDLPIHLKNCFLYFGLFPEDHRINARELIRLWVAEGFVQATEENTMEEVAQEYLIDLINKSMVQMVEEDYIGGVETCRVHDLMREIAILKATQTRFLSTKPSTDARRLTICETAGKDEAAIGDQTSFKNLRTLLAFDTDSEKITFICNGSPRVKVLQSSCCEIDDVHDFGRKHCHLRYLAIDGVVRKDISCLYHLQTLSVKYVKAINISQLRNLRHLILDYTVRDIDGLWGAKNLQTLEGIRAGDWIESSLSKLTKLRTLKINKCEGSHGKALAESLVRLKCLVTLHLEGKGGYPSLCTLSSLVNFRDLDIIGWDLSFIGPVPESDKELPPNLNRLRLLFCDPKHYPIEMLGKLTCLRFIYIDEYSYDLIDDYEVWNIKHGDFPHLQVLDLSCVKRLREWIIEDGALQQLHHLKIYRCDELKMLPDGLRHISTLRELYLTIQRGTPLEGRAEKETGDDWDKIKHVPLINVTYD